MKRPLALAMLLLHCFTLTAEAKYLNKTTGVDSGSALNPQTAWKTVAYANANLPADSTIYFAANDTVLDVAINPVNPGTTWMGDSVTPANAKVPGLSINKPFTTVRGFRVVGSLNTGSTGIYAHVRKSHILSGASLNKRGARIEGCRIGVGAYASWFDILPSPGDTDSFTIKNNTMYLVNFGTGSLESYLMRWQPSVNTVTMKNWTVSGNVCTLQIRNGQIYAKTLFWGGLRRASFNGNTWLMRDSSGLNGSGNQGMVLRDSVKECRWVNDRFEFWSPDGSGQARAFFYSSGNQIADSANSWKFCTFKSNINSGGQAAFYNEWRAAYRDSIYRNVYVCNKYGPCVEFQGANDSTFFYRNTVANLGGGEAVTLVPDGNNAGAWGGANGRFQVSGNIFYSVGGQGSTYWTVPDFASNLFASDWNLYFTPTVNGQDRAWKYKRWSSGQVPSLMRVGEPNTYNLELNSTWGDPMFEDDSYATFDADLGFVDGVASYAKATGPSGVDCGAKDYVAPPPAVVDDMQSQGGTSNSVTLAWTAPGENGDVGTATSYDVRYSTSEITDQNFTSATEASGEPSPSVAGTWETFTVTGLSPTTVYYFALRTSNATRTSNTSNCVSERTWPSGTIEP